VPEADADAAELLYRTRYSGFTAKHFHEHLVGTHALRWGYTRTKALLHKRGLLAARRPGGAPAQASASALAVDDAAPGRVTARLGGGPARVRPGGDAGWRDEARSTRAVLAGLCG
jgi:hypothetical protein